MGLLAKAKLQSLTCRIQLSPGRQERYQPVDFAVLNGKGETNWIGAYHLPSYAPAAHQDLNNITVSPNIGELCNHSRDPTFQEHVYLAVRFRTRHGICMHLWDWQPRAIPLLFQDAYYAFFARSPCGVGGLRGPQAVLSSLSHHPDPVSPACQLAPTEHPVPPEPASSHVWAAPLPLPTLVLYFVLWPAITGYKYIIPGWHDLKVYTDPIAVKDFNMSNVWTTDFRKTASIRKSSGLGKAGSETRARAHEQSTAVEKRQGILLIITQYRNTLCTCQIL